MARRRICIIGAGTAGMSTLHHFAKMEEMPDVVLFEKQKTWGGQWNVPWKTGVDENGEPIQASTYKYMWCNGPKEAHEYHDYTFDQHFGQETPSFASLVVFRNYLEGRFTRGAPRNRNLKDYIQFNTAVKHVKYSDEEDRFTVFVNDYNTGRTREETFSHVIVATGIFHTPNLPEFPGINEFKGRVLHSHDFHDARDFSGKRVLIIGAGYTGEDLVLQCLKFGAKSIILAHRTRPKSDTCTMPDGVEERPNVEHLDSENAYFTDGSSAEIDSIILSTGYRNYFPFLEDRFRIPEKTHFYPEGLYKASLYYKAGNNRLFYIGSLAQINSFTYFEVMASWTTKYIMGQLPNEPKDKTEMEADSKVWIGRVNACKTESNFISFQKGLIEHLADLGGYTKDVTKYSDLLQELIGDRKQSLGLANYRDRCYKSIYTGRAGLEQTPFMKNYDESVETFLKYAKKDTKNKT